MTEPDSKSGGQCTATGLEIAVIGMAGRFPGARDVDELWTKLRNGVESIVFFSDDDVLASGVDPVLVKRPDYVKAGGYLEGVDLFDAAFFGYNPREATVMDPQQRLFLETAWTALEHAGQDPLVCEGPIGIYAGVGMNTYLFRHVLGPEGLLDPHMDHSQVVGNDKDFFTTRVSYKLNLQGPSVVVQSACSTSLVAIHLACQGLLSGDCDMALAGGMTVRIPQKIGYLYQEEGISSPDGHCRAFDANARGCLPGNGGGVVVLKRLADALAEGDFIHAIIKGTAINNDGGEKVGYTAPRVDGQAKVIRAAQTIAEVDAGSIGYVETHGTGTPLGDPIEIEALTKAFRMDTAENGFCAIGAIKSNLGHLDAGAGVAGFIKTVMALEHAEIPPSLHFETPNPTIDFDSSPFYVNGKLSPWKSAHGFPRRAGVSSFGIGGANAHAILEEAPSPERSSQTRPCSLLVLSAKTESALETASRNLARFLREHPETRLADAAYTSQVGRQRFNHTRSLACRDVAEAIARLESPRAPRVVTSRCAATERGVVFMFPGQGSQHPGMGKGLYESEAEFRRQVDRCAEILEPLLDVNLIEALYPDADESARAEQRLNNTHLAQPAIFVIEYALARLWMSWGVRPRAMVGHSIGEYTAACLAGVFNLEDALRLVAERGRLMSKLPPGAMLAVPLAHEQLEHHLRDELSLAAVNSPSLSVVSGPIPAIAELHESLGEQGVECRPLHTSHAFHSAMMDGVLEPFTRCVAQVQLNSPAIPYVSNVSGTWISQEQATDPDYWASHLRQTVRFSAGLQTLMQEFHPVFIELGPGQTLSAIARQHPQADPGSVCSAMRHPHEEHSDTSALLSALGRYWCQGGRIDWDAFYVDERRLRIPLPTYPFERQSYWMDATCGYTAVPSPRQSLRKRADIGQWFYVPSWKRVPLAGARAADPDAGAWVIFEDPWGLAAALSERIRGAGVDVYTVTAGKQFAHRGECDFEIDPGEPDDYRRLLTELRQRGHSPRRIVHCWGVAPGSCSGLALVDEHLSNGFYSVLFTAQALGAEASVDAVRFTVIGSHIQSVGGEERICPDKATVLGPCRTIPLEYPQMTCVSVDVVLPETPGDARAMLVEALLEELHCEETHPVVAIRSRYRWVQSYESLSLDVDGGRERLKDNGVYLITGGLGGIGLTLAEHLARRCKAKLVLIGRSGLPPREEWDEWLSRGARVQWSPVRLAEIEAQASRERSGATMAETADLSSTLDCLCSSYVLDYFTCGGIDVTSGRMLRFDDIRHTLGICPQFHRLVDAMLSMLVEDGCAAIHGDLVEFLPGAREANHPAQLSQGLRVQFPAYGPVLDLLHNCLEHYPQALRGEISAISVLYGEGNLEFFRTGVEAALTHSDIGTYHRLVRDLIDQVSETNRGGRFRMLEVGGGGGLLTRSLVPLLHGRDVEYHFTDIGKSFVNDARRTASSQCLEFMRFGTLDISKDPSAQGYPPGSFDLVLGFNVVHATPRVEATLGHLKDLLTPGGLLVMVEPIRRQRWVDLVWGLTEGWWSFEDTDIRTLSPLLGLSQWEKEVERLGFQQITVYPSDNAARVQADTGLIVAEKPRDAAQNEAGNPPAAATPLDELSIQSRIQRVRKLEDMGAEVMVFDADVADRARMQEVIGRARVRFGTIDGAIHAALILDDGAIQLKAAESARRVMSPKVHGTLVLADLLRESDLDFFVMFSSLVGVLGGSGQVDYCAASNFQDAFAQACNPGLARSVISIDWGLWREVGKALRSAVEHGSTAKDALPEGMSTAEGLDAFARVMSHDQTQVLISTQPLEALLSRAGRAGWRPSEEHLVAPSVAQSRSETHGAYVAPRNEVESAIAEIWSTVLGIARIGVHDNFFDLGVDSVVSLQFIARAKALGLNFTNKQVFQHQTIAELATVADIDGGAQPQSELPATAGAGSACDDVQPPSPARFPGARISERDLDRVLGRIGAAGEDKLE